MKRKHPAIFLDRDGTMIDERGYLSDPGKIKFFPTALRGLRLLSKTGWPLIIISNQSGVARGYFSKQQLRKVHQRLLKILGKHNVRIAGAYFCTHLPDAGCACRKPGTKFPRHAAKKFHLDLLRSFVIGDQSRDMQLARNIGATGVLVGTGWGHVQRKKAGPLAKKQTRNLYTAARWILTMARQNEK